MSRNQIQSKLPSQVDLWQEISFLILYLFLILIYDNFIYFLSVFFFLYTVLVSYWLIYDNIYQIQTIKFDYKVWTGRKDIISRLNSLWLNL